MAFEELQEGESDQTIIIRCRERIRVLLSPGRLADMDIEIRHQPVGFDPNLNGPTKIAMDASDRATLKEMMPLTVWSINGHKEEP